MLVHTALTDTNTHQQLLGQNASTRFAFVWAAWKSQLCSKIQGVCQISLAREAKPSAELVIVIAF